MLVLMFGQAIIQSNTNTYSSSFLSVLCKSFRQIASSTTDGPLISFDRVTYRGYT